MKKRRLALVLIVLLCCTSADAEPTEDRQAPNVSRRVDELLTRLENRGAPLETLTTDFIQEKHLAVLERPLVLKGTIFMQQPTLFAWHVREPLRYSMVIQGEVVRQWDEDTGRVQKLSLSKNPALRAAIGQMRGWFSGAYKALLGEYEVAVLSQSPTSLKFIPRPQSFAEHMIDSVTILFDDDERYIRRIHIREKGGDSTVIFFLHPLFNTPIDPAAWKVKQRVQ